MKNKIAVRLTLYFTAVLLVFGVIIGCIFYQFFKDHTVELKKREMTALANRLALVISDNQAVLERYYGGGFTDSRFLGYVDNMTSDIVWLVDEERRLIVNRDEKRFKYGRPAAGEGKMPPPPEKTGMRPPPPELPVTDREAYERLPEHIRLSIEAAFAGKRFTIEEYNPILEDLMLTVGVPVTDEAGRTRAVLLLHSPVRGMQDAIWAGLRILLYSLVAALLLGLILSVLLSVRFTKPVNIMRKIAERLADRDYGARSNIRQDDEIGELARTLDVLAERLETADRESQQLEQLRKDFVANISHELRTPVTVIRGSLEALSDGVVTDPEEVKAYYGQMYKESLFLQRLINDLLDLSRLQNKDFPIEKEPVDFCGVIHDAVRGSRQIGKKKNIEITAETDKESYMLSGDYGRLKQLLMIFLDNAVKFSGEGAEVLVKLSGSVLEIIDHGCGMKPEDVEHAFVKFYKAHNEQNKEGSGLGLSIAKQIALRHDMELTLESVVGKGTTIRIKLPPELEMREQSDE